MSEEGTPFTGILYAGLIATTDGPKVIEFNARFGDPETEVILPRLTSDLGAGISAILNGETPQFGWAHDNATVGVILASDGYPDAPVTGAAIPAIPSSDNIHVFYAGVKNAEYQGESTDSAASQLVSDSGRVLLVECTAADIATAQQQVYELLDSLDVTGLFYRHDIGAKALNR
jgi:phosphoribosylamine--glycine ligase